MLSGRRRVRMRKSVRQRRQHSLCCQRRWTWCRSTVGSWVVRSWALQAWTPSITCGIRTLRSSSHEIASPWVATALLQRWQSSVPIQRCLSRWVDFWAFVHFTQCQFIFVQQWLYFNKRRCISSLETKCFFLYVNSVRKNLNSTLCVLMSESIYQHPVCHLALVHCLLWISVLQVSAEFCGRQT